MIDFQPISLENAGWIREILRRVARPNCEYSFGNIFTYGAMMPLGAAKVCGCLVTRCETKQGDYYCFPVGGDEAKALKELIATAEAIGRPAWIYGINEENKDLLKQLFPGRYAIDFDRDSFDYVYRTEDLITLSGKKYQSKRNHIAFFMRNTRWQYETITPAAIPECLQMSEDWLAQSGEEFREDLEGELKIIRRAFENYVSLGYVGGLLRADGRVIAYTMGEALREDIFCVHFEKAYGQIRGAYPMINQQFAQNELQSYLYINREDDVGIENLRRAKESYHPAFMIEKYETRIV